MVAEWFQQRREVERVLHPALPSCPGHSVWKRDFTGSSGLFSVVFAKPANGLRLQKFVDALELFKIGYSWGGVTSLAVPFDVSARTDVPYGDRLVRFHIGLEDPADLIGDLERALAVLA
jgi:cystathionine beta-lyase